MLVSMYLKFVNNKDNWTWHINNFRLSKLSIAMRDTLINNILGIVCYSWDEMDVSISAFASELTLFRPIVSAIIMRPISR